MISNLFYEKGLLIFFFFIKDLNYTTGVDLIILRLNNGFLKGLKSSVFLIAIASTILSKVASYNPRQKSWNTKQVLPSPHFQC